MVLKSKSSSPSNFYKFLPFLKKYKIITIPQELQHRWNKDTNTGTLGETDRSDKVDAADLIKAREKAATKRNVI